MRRYITIGPALVVLLTAAITLFAAPMAVRQVMMARTAVAVAVAQQRLDGDTLLEQLNAASRTVADAVEPSVVHIEASTGGRMGSYESSGAGWVYDHDGHIVTNAHVVHEADRVMVQFYDGHTEPATIVGVDLPTDVAVLKVGDDAGVIPARRATGLPVRKGERVFAFGSPFGFKFSMTEGIVSGLGREAFGVTGAAGYTNFIQTDAAVNPGNSGGPLVDVNGRVVGMNTAIVTGENPQARTDVKSQSAGIGFAIPLETIESVTSQFIERGLVLRGYLGVSLVDRPAIVTLPDGRREPGVRIGAVMEGQPAARAGLRANDIVTKIDGEATPSVVVLRGRISARKPGEIVQMTVWRDGARMEAPVSIGAATLTRDREMVPVDPAHPERADPEMARIEAANQRLSRFGIVGLIPDDRGALITMVRANSPAFEKGFRSGQVITQIHGAAVADPDAVYGAIAGLRRGSAPVEVIAEDGEVRQLEIVAP